MAPDSRSDRSVLIVDADAAIRELIATVLEHAGFCTVGVDDLRSATMVSKSSSFAVILRDLNLAPHASCGSLQQLVATAPQLLRRTVVMTTAPERATAVVRAGSVFAIVSKPFDMEKLVNAVRECARGSRDGGHGGARRTPSSRRSRESEPEAEAEASMRPESVHRFVKAVPTLKHLLSAPVGSHREAVLRAEIRRMLGALAATLTEASHVEASKSRAAVFRAASTAAGRLATLPAPGTAIAGSGRRDH